MSPFRTSSPATSTAVQRPVSRPLVAIVAAFAGTVGAFAAGATAHPSAASRPSAISRPARTAPRSLTGAALPVRSSAPGRVQLDAFLGAAVAGTASKKAASNPTPQQVAIGLLHAFGWTRYQFGFLNALWARESGWKVRALNQYSGAYGIPQAVPGSKMAAAGPHWQTSASTQIRWGLSYIRERYGSPRAAWRHEVATGWY